MRNARWAVLVIVVGCSSAGREAVDGGEEPCPRINCSDAGGAESEPTQVVCGCQCERGGVELLNSVIECVGVLSDVERMTPAWERWFALEAGACSAATPCDCGCGCQLFANGEGPCTLERLQEAAE